MSEDATLDEFLQVESEENNGSEWGESKLEDLLSELLTGGRPTGGGLDEGEYISIGGTQVDSEGYIDLHDLVYIPEDYFEQVEETQLQKHDILVVKDGANTGDVAIAWESDERIVTNEHLFTLRSDSSISSPYLFYFLLSHQGWKQINGTITGSAQEGINRGFTGKVDVRYPPLPEQRKIASILYNVDQAIQKTESLIARYDRLQTGLLRQYFGKSSVQVDYSDDRVTKRLGPKNYTVPDDWQIVQIDDIGEVVTGDTPSTKNEDYYGGELPFVTPEDFGEGRYVYQGSRRLTDEGRQKSRPVPEDSVMMDCIGMDMGKVRIAGRELATNQQINSVIVNQDNMLPEFLYYHLKAISNLIQSQAGQTRTPIVSKSQFTSFEVFKPPLSAQKEVVDSLSVFDELVEKESDYATRLHRLKQGLMQDLLAGTVRTADTNIEVLDEVAQHG
jgi:type I restriction enzyme S subunit